MLKHIAQIFKVQNEFPKRIKHRHRIFWTPPDAEYIRNTIMNAGDPVEKWKDVEHWQRKLSNKYNAREFARMHHCNVARLYWKGRDPERIDFSALPPHYVIRPTIGHSCNKVFLMRGDLNLMDKQVYTKHAIFTILKEMVMNDPYQEILIEEFLRSEAGEYRIPDDYKIYVFNGEVAFIALINRFGRRTGQHNFYDETWSIIRKCHSGYPMAPYQPPPRCLNQMLRDARELSKAYEIFVRIDFYATDRGAVFGEFTPTPSLGYGFSKFGEQRLLSYWDLYCKGRI